MPETYRPVNLDTSEARTDVMPINFDALENRYGRNKTPESNPKSLAELSINPNFIVDESNTTYAFRTNIQNPEQLGASISSRNNLKTGINTYPLGPETQAVVFVKKESTELLEELKEGVGIETFYDATDSERRRNYAIQFNGTSTGIQARAKFNTLRSNTKNRFDVDNSDSIAGNIEANKQDLDNSLSRALSIVVDRNKGPEELRRQIPEGFKVKFTRDNKGGGYVELYNDEAVRAGGAAIRIYTEITADSGELSGSRSIRTNVKNVELVFNKNAAVALPQEQWRYVSGYLRPEKKLDAEQTIVASNQQKTDNTNAPQAKQTTEQVQATTSAREQTTQQATTEEPAIEMTKEEAEKAMLGDEFYNKKYSNENIDTFTEVQDELWEQKRDVKEGQTGLDMEIELSPLPELTTREAKHTSQTIEGLAQYIMNCEDEKRKNTAKEMLADLIIEQIDNSITYIPSLDQIKILSNYLEDEGKLRKINDAYNKGQLYLRALQLVRQNKIDFTLHANITRIVTKGTSKEIIDALRRIETL